MADGKFNIALGRIADYAAQAGVGNAAFVVVLLKAAEVDDTLNNYDDLGALLAAAGNTECDFTNYLPRKTITVVTETLDDTGNTKDESIGDLVYTDAGGATNNSIVKILICFDPDTTVGTDADIVPLTHHDASVTTDGSTVTFTENASGFWGSS